MLEPRKSKAKATTTKKDQNSKTKKNVQRGKHRTQLCNCKMCCCFGTGDDTWSKTQTHETTESAVCGYFGSLEYYVCARATAFVHCSHNFYIICFRLLQQPPLICCSTFVSCIFTIDFSSFSIHTHTHDSIKMPATYATTRFAFDCNHCYPLPLVLSPAPFFIRCVALIIDCCRIFGVMF